MSKKSSSTWYRRFGTWLLGSLFSCLLFCFGSLSLRSTRRLARIAAFLISPFLGERKRVIEANLRLVFSELSPNQIRKLRQRNIAFMIEFGLDFLQTLKHPERMRQRICPFDIPEALKDPEHAGIFCSPHLGNWEMLVQVISFSERPFVLVAAELNIPPLAKLLREQRSSRGAEVVSSRGAALKVRKALQEKKFVGLLNDQNTSPKHGGIFVEFFGLPVCSSRLPASLARRHNAVLAAAACCKTASGQFEFLFEPLPKHSSEYESDWDLTSDLLAANEKLIRKYPEQYLWIYHRWRYVPNNIPGWLQRRYPFYARPAKYACQEEMLELLKEKSEQDE
ncbi:MAG: lysophospholipid acyltransferase family protein [Oligosphaeraceae bacterium]|nr:lysophospholipid acyltransferase family protein [Oligosphaeraceae bacterium]